VVIAETETDVFPALEHVAAGTVALRDERQHIHFASITIS
jgi:hypothetical protein